MKEDIDDLLYSLHIENESLKLLLYEMTEKDFTESITIIKQCTAELVKTNEAISPDVINKFINIEFNVIRFLKLLQASCGNINSLYCMILLLNKPLNEHILGPYQVF